MCNILGTDIAELLFRLVPENRECDLAVERVRSVQDPIAETAEHWDHSKLLLERHFKELFEHRLLNVIMQTVVLEHQALVDHVNAATRVTVFGNQVEHRSQVAVPKVRLGRRQLVSETLVVGL